MRLLARLVCAVAIIGTFLAHPVGAQGVMQGYQDAQMRQQYLQMQQLCLQAMHGDLSAQAVHPCVALRSMQWPSSPSLSYQPRPSINCTTQHFGPPGNGLGSWDDTTCY